MTITFNGFLITEKTKKMNYLFIMTGKKSFLSESWSTLKLSIMYDRIFDAYDFW